MELEVINIDYHKDYRKQIGFTNKAEVKNFFKAGDIERAINYDYIIELNKRLHDIVDRISIITPASISPNDLVSFKNKYIDNAYQLILNNNLLPKFNNQGRQPEQVYYSWMRGNLICNFYLHAITKIYNLSASEIKFSGDDDLSVPDTFRKTPSADLEFDSSELQSVVRLEIQSGFTGVNDIKQHKILEARKRQYEDNIITFIVHFDMFNGQAAILRIDNVPENSINWITRQQMEGQTVFNIDQSLFTWKLTETPPFITEIKDLVNAE